MEHGECRRRVARPRHIIATNEEPSQGLVETSQQHQTTRNGQCTAAHAQAVVALGLMYCMPCMQRCMAYSPVICIPLHQMSRFRSARQGSCTGSCHEAMQAAAPANGFPPTNQKRTWKAGHQIHKHPCACGRPKDPCRESDYDFDGCQPKGNSNDANLLQHQAAMKGTAGEKAVQRYGTPATFDDDSSVRHMAVCSTAPGVRCHCSAAIQAHRYTCIYDMGSQHASCASGT